MNTSKLKRKTFIVRVTVLLFLLAITGAALVSNPFKIQSSGIIDVLAQFFAGAQYFVGQYDDGSYYMIRVNGTDWQLEATGSDADQILNWALGNLSSYASNYQIVRVVGNFIIDSQITISKDYTLLDLEQAYIKLADSMGSQIIMLYAEDRQHIKVKGGVFDGNRAQQTVNQKGILWDNVSDGWIDGTTVAGVYATSTDSHGVKLIRSTDCLVQNFVIKNNKHCGASISEGCKRVIFKDGFFLNNADSAQNAAHLVIWAPNADHIIEDSGVINCFANNSGNQGFQIYQYTNGSFIEGCTVQYWDNAAIVLGNSPTNYNARVSNNIIAHMGPLAGKKGIECWSGHSVITGNTIRDVYHGIISFYDDNNTVISNNYISDVEYGMKIHSSKNVITGNEIYEAIQVGIEIDDYTDYQDPSNNTVTNNIIYADSTAIRVIGGLYNYFSGNILSGSNTDISINIDSVGNIVEGNYFDSASVAGINNVVRFNKGYKTEFYGSQIVANNEKVVHGLVATPVVVQVSCGNATYDGETIVVGVASVSATDIQVSVYWANGTAITSDVILIYISAQTWT